MLNNWFNGRFHTSIHIVSAHGGCILESLFIITHTLPGKCVLLFQFNSIVFLYPLCLLLAAMPERVQVVFALKFCCFDFIDFSPRCRYNSIHAYVFLFGSLFIYSICNMLPPVSAANRIDVIRTAYIFSP